MTTTRRPDRLTADPDRTSSAPAGVRGADVGHADARGTRGRRPGGHGGRAWRRWGVVALLVLAAGAWAVQGVDLSAAADRLLSGAARGPGTPTGTVPASEPPRASDPAGAGDPAGEGDPAGAGDAVGLDPELQRRLDAAVAAAAADGIELTLTSGRRTPEEQQRLVDQAVERYGVPEAYRWVLPPDRSAHVQGLAVDVGPTDGALWLGEHGEELGLCRTYANEMWHFEMLPDGATTCPEQRPDSSWAW